MSAARAYAADIAKAVPATTTVFNKLMDTVPYLCAPFKRAHLRQLSALALDRRRVDIARRLRHLAAGPAQPEHEVVRREIAESVGIRDAAAETVHGVRDRAVIEIAIGQIDLE